MERIFISSLARGEMAAIRQSARRAVESLDMVPVMFETGAAAGEASRRELLDRLAKCDAVVLLLGAEYGEQSARGVSPTEEEFQEAQERGIPVLALVQDAEREPGQEDFLWRVRGDWERGRLTADFTDASDVGYAVVKALNVWRSRRQSGDLWANAAGRAVDLAKAGDRPGVFYGGSKLRLVVVPALDRDLLDAVAIRDPTLVEDLAAAARAAGLVPQSVGVEGAVGRDEIVLALKGGRGFEDLALRVGFDGSVVAEGAVGGDEMGFGGSVVMADRARQVIEQGTGFSELVWNRIDARDEVRELAVVCAVPEAEHKVYALAPVGSSMHMPMSMPRVLIARQEPLRARRADLGSSVDRLQAELHRAFEVEGAVHDPTH